MMFYRFSGKEILRHKFAFREYTGEYLRSIHEEMKEGRLGRGRDEMQGSLNKGSSWSWQWSQNLDGPLAVVFSREQGTGPLYLLPHTTDQSLVIGCF